MLKNHAKYFIRQIPYIESISSQSNQKSNGNYCFKGEQKLPPRGELRLRATLAQSIRCAREQRRPNDNDQLERLRRSDRETSRLGQARGAMHSKASQQSKASVATRRANA